MAGCPPAPPAPDPGPGPAPQAGQGPRLGLNRTGRVRCLPRYSPRVQCSSTCNHGATVRCECRRVVPRI